MKRLCIATGYNSNSPRFIFCAQVMANMGEGKTRQPSHEGEYRNFMRMLLDDLQALENSGIEMLVCGTCLGYFELKDRLVAGQVSNMYDIAEAMLTAGKVVNL